MEEARGAKQPGERERERAGVVTAGQKELSLLWLKIRRFLSNSVTLQ